MPLTPIYTRDNCKFAYQLCWSLTVFWRELQHSSDWLGDLKSATECDGVRVLRHRFGQNDSSLFLVSTRPEFKPSEICRSVKGRLQYLVRDRRPRAFQRNYDLRSVGSTTRENVEAYVAAQLRQHPPVNDRFKDKFTDLQIVQSEVDLSRPRFTSHGRYSCNLHIVLVHAFRWECSEADDWLRVRDMIRRASSAKGHLLSRVGIVPDHLHLTLGTHPDEAPLEVALGYMNNISFAYGMRAIFMNGCYLTGFGEYDLGAVSD